MQLWLLPESVLKNEKERRNYINTPPIFPTRRRFRVVSCRKLIYGSPIHEESKEEEKVVKAASIEWKLYSYTMFYELGKRNV